jgi:hypothetical protein
MEKQFHLVLSLKTVKGFIDFGWYALGNDRKTAGQLFAQMKGSDTLADSGALHIDLIEMIDELPCKVESLSCTLDELCSNLKLITREMFRLKNLEEMS